MAGVAGPVHVTTPAGAVLDALPGWVRLVRAPNPGAMTLDGTNTWILRPPGHSAAVLIDPGPEHDGHLAALAAEGPYQAVLLTHGHQDHTEGVPRLLERTGAVPVRGAATIPGVDQPLAGGDELTVGALTVRVLAAPGHTADSVCYLAECDGDRVVFTGDTVLGRGTTVVAWPDGDLGAYLASLERLAELGDLPVLPGHGPALAGCTTAARFYLAHRRARLEQVRAAVATGARTPAQVVDAVYGDLPADLRPAAEWSARAQLAFLSAGGGT